MNLLKPIISCSFQLALILTCYAQQYELTRFADHNGLPVRIIRGAMQDQAGFLWVAGNNGLFKYDGQKFNAFYAPMNDTTGLRDNKIFITEQTTDSKIWIGSARGLHYFDGDGISYFNLKGNDEPAIISLFEDRNEKLWVGTFNGMHVLEKSANGEYIKNPIYRTKIPQKAVWGFAEDRRKNIWIITSAGAYFANDQLPNIIRKASLQYLDNLQESALKIYRFQEYADSIFIVDSQSGLLKGTLNSNASVTLEKFKSPAGDQLAPYHIYYSLIDSENYIWLATYRNRIKKYKLSNGELEEVNIELKNGLEGMAAHAIAIAEDRQKNIWVSNANGLFKLSKNSNKLFNFPHELSGTCLKDVFSPSAITEDAYGYLWIATVKGLYRMPKEDILSRKCMEDYYFTDGFKKINDLYIDEKNRLWVSAESGLEILELDENFELLNKIHYGKSNGLPHDHCHDIYQENANTFWLANYSGLVKVNIPKGDIYNLDFNYFQSEKDREGSLVNSWVQGLGTDSEKNIWLATAYGLSQLLSESKSGDFQNFTNNKNSRSISNNSIKQIFNDRQGNLWIGTQRGLNLYQKESGDFIRFGRKKGLPSEYILGLQQDAEDNLWVATTNGLFIGKYEPNCQCFEDINYIKREEGLADNITNRNAFYIDKLGNAFIGSSKGLSVYKNEKIIVAQKEFNLALTRISSTQKNQPGFVNIRSRIANNNIDLRHFENSIDLSYAVLDLTDPIYNKYRHKLLPIDNEWVFTENDADLTYYNLNHGKYELILDGTNKQGVWSADPIHLNINIFPPWYLSKWAYLMYSLLGLLGLRLFYLWRVRKKLNAIEKKAKLDKAVLKEKVRLRKENAADFHDELGSRVTKISLYLTLAERNLSEQKEVASWFSKIRTNVTDLSGMFRDLLWVIDPEKDSLAETFFRLKEFGEELFQDSNIVFRTYGDFEKQTNKQLDAQTKKQVLLIFKEGMHNAMKYSQAEKITLTFLMENENVGIKLNDNGIGFNIKTKGKGRGLKNMKTRAQKINAELNITSGKTGTSILLNRIPYIRDAKD